MKKSYQKLKNENTAGAVTPWSEAWKAIGLYLLLAFCLNILVSLLEAWLLGDKIAEYRLLVASYSPNPSPLLNVMQDTRNSPLLGMLQPVISLFVIFGVIHFFATAFGGTGSLPGIIVHANRWQMLIYVLTSLVGLIGYYLLVNAVISQLSSEMTAETAQRLLRDNRSLANTPALAVNLIWALGLSRIVSQYYQIGQGKGCLVVFLLGLTMISISCGLLYVFA